MSRYPSKPYEIATVTSGNAFTQPGSPPTDGRVPHHGVYHPDSVEIELVASTPGQTGVVNGPIWLDVWAYDPDTNTERVMEQVQLSATSEPVPSAIPPVQHKGNARAYSLRSGLTSVDVVGRVVFVEKTR